MSKHHIFTNSEGSHFCQSGRALFLSTRRDTNLDGQFLPTRKASFFANSERSYNGQLARIPMWKCPVIVNSEGHQSGGAVFTNPEWSYFCQLGRVPFLQIWKGPTFIKSQGSHFGHPEGSSFCWLGRVPFSLVRKDPIFDNSHESQSWKVLFLSTRNDTNPMG